MKLFELRPDWAASCTFTASMNDACRTAPQPTRGSVAGKMAAVESPAMCKVNAPAGASGAGGKHAAIPAPPAAPALDARLPATPPSETDPALEPATELDPPLACGVDPPEPALAAAVS